MLQTAVNLGILLACAVVWLLADVSSRLAVAFNPRWVFLVGVVPALIVFWIRRNVPEGETWREARRAVRERPPGFRDLFAPAIRRTTLLTILVCACSLTAWWAFMFWHAQHLRHFRILGSSSDGDADARLVQDEPQRSQHQDGDDDRDNGSDRDAERTQLNLT